MRIGISLALTQPRAKPSGGSSPPPPTTAGQPIGLLLILTKAS